MRKMLAAGLLGALCACGADPQPLATTADAAATKLQQGATFAMTVEPTAFSIGAGASPTPLSASWNVVLRETSGLLGGKVNFINATIRDAQSGAVAEPGHIVLDAAAIAAAAGGNRIAAGGALVVPFSLRFSLWSGGTAAVVSIAAECEDDTGEAQTTTAQAELR
jgi:hypothetical protein